MSERRERSAERPGRSVYDDREREPVAPLSIRMVDGRIVGVVDARGRFFPEPPCCDDPMQCERPECWTRLAELRS